MSKDESGEPSTLTEVIVAELVDRSESSLTKDQVTPFGRGGCAGSETVANKAIVDEHRLAHVEAVLHNPETAADKTIVDEDRLAHIEKQTHGLAEAVIAITETATRSHLPSKP